MDHEGVLIAHHGPLPQGLTEGVDGDNVAVVLPELFQQGKLLGGEGDLPAIPPEGSRPPMDLRAAQPGGLLLGGGAVHPAEHCMQPQQQLLGQKGFGDVVVGAQSQAPEPGLVLIPGGEKEHRDVPLLPQLAQQREPIAVGEHHVQENGVGMDLGPLG